MREKILNRFVFLAFGFSGAAALIYEVVWTRSLSTIMGSSTYAVSTMLAAFMAGLSLGGWIGSRLAVKTKKMAVLFAFCEFGIGLFGLLMVPLIKSLTPVFIYSYYKFHLSFDSFLVVQFLLNFLIMGVPTTLMGMTFPFVIKYFSGSDKDAGRVSGQLYSVNTLGAIVGSISAGFLLIPLLGVRAAAVVAASLNIVSAVVIFFLSHEHRTTAVAAVSALVLYVASSFPLGAVNVPVFSYYTAPRFESFESAMKAYRLVRESAWRLLLYQHEGVNGDVYVTRNLGREGSSPFTLISNGKFEGGDDKGFALLGNLPYASHPGKYLPLKALSIGLGSGNTLQNLAELPLEKLDCVELSSGVFEANFRFFEPRLFEDPRVGHFHADGRNFLLLSKDSYDMIVVSPSWAVETASAGLLTREFFNLSSQKLADDGIFAIWVDYFLESKSDMDVILRTVSSVFPHVRVWSVRGTTGVVITASKSPFSVSVYDVMQDINARKPSLVGKFMAVLDESDVRSISEGPINTDDRPIIEFRNARNIIVGPEALQVGR